jgi:nitrate reductase gamma subunit
MIDPVDELLEPKRGHDPFDRVLALLVKVQTPLGLLLVVAGFVAVFLAWLEASGTADVRVQMQDLISGGVGGLGMLIVGGVLLQSALADRAARRTEAGLSRLADALDLGAQLATGEPTIAQAAAPRDPRAAVAVLATHASYHLPACDLLAGRDAEQVQPTTVRQARRNGLAACRVCFGTAAGA